MKKSEENRDIDLLRKAEKGTPQYEKWLFEYLKKRRKLKTQNDEERIFEKDEAFRTIRFNKEVNAAWAAAGDAAKDCFNVLQRQDNNDGKKLSRTLRVKRQLELIFKSQVLSEVAYEDLSSMYPRLNKIEGAEAKIFMAEGDDFILKLQDFSVNSDTPLDYIFNRIFLHNLLFPETAYTLEAICLDNSETNQSFKFLVSQPFIYGREPSFEEFDSYMKGRGLKPGKNNIYSNEFIRICDVPAKNVLVGPSNEILFIDEVIEPIYESLE